MNFDFACGNPPYNAADGSLLYDKFTFVADDISDQTAFVIPARWTVTGRGTKALRTAVMNHEISVKSLDFISEKESGFRGVAVGGGYCILVLESGWDDHPLVEGDPFDTSRLDIILKDVRYPDVVIEVLEKADEFLDERFIAQCHSGIESNLISRDTEEDEILCFDTPEGMDDPIRIVASKIQGFEKWIEAEHTRHQGGGFWKVGTPLAAGRYNNGFGNLVVLGPRETCTGSYIAFRCRSEEEAHNLRAYLKTHFVEFFLELRRSNHIICGNALKWVPLPDLSRKWADETLRAENPFNISETSLDIVYEEVT